MELPQEVEDSFVRNALAELKNDKTVSAIYLELIDKGCTEESAKSTLNKATELYRQNKIEEANRKIFWGGILLMIILLLAIIFFVAIESTGHPIKVFGVLPLLGIALWKIIEGKSLLSESRNSYPDKINKQIQQLDYNKIKSIQPKGYISSGPIESSLLKYLRYLNYVCVVWTIANIIYSLGFTLWGNLIEISSHNLNNVIAQILSFIFGFIVLFLLPLIVVILILTLPYIFFLDRIKTGNGVDVTFICNTLAIIISSLYFKNSGNGSPLSDLTYSWIYLAGLVSLLNLAFCIRIKFRKDEI